MVHRNRHEQIKYWALSWVGLAQELVVIVTLGFLCPDWRAKVLFSDWMDS